MFLQKDTKILGITPQFQEYVTEVKISGGNVNKGVPLLPEDNFKFSIDRFLPEITSDYALIYIDNPTNPTGQIINLEEIEKIVSEAKKRSVVVILDEAELEYVGEEHSAISLLDKWDNIIVTHSFTKAYGLSALRVGYGLFPKELSGYYDKVDLPFPIPAVASYLCLEGLRDQEFVRSLRQSVKNVKEKLLVGLRQRKFLISETHPSSCFFLMGHSDNNTDLKEYLLQKGIVTVWERILTMLVRIGQESLFQLTRGSF